MTVTLLFEYNSPEGMWYIMQLAFEYFYFFVQMKLLLVVIAGFLFLNNLPNILFRCIFCFIIAFNFY